MTWIERLEREGHRRLGSKERGFRWVSAHGRPLPRAEVERLQRLRLPPAWRDVRAHPSPRAKLQAVGTDARGRVQYRYHPAFRARREAEKFARVVPFARALPAMRAAVARDLALPGLPRARVLACMLRILSRCFLRPGSDVYAAENGSFGLATLRREHVRVRGDRVLLRFPGKAGKVQERELEDRPVARVVRELLRVHAREVFAFVEPDGTVVDVKRRHVNRYIKEVMGERFSAKDFRTWAGTVTCAELLAGAAPAAGPRAVRRQVTEAVKETAAVLGNTPAVCRSSYIWPGILDAFSSGRGIPAGGERAVLAMLREERPLTGQLRARVAQAARRGRRRA